MLSYIIITELLTVEFARLQHFLLVFVFFFLVDVARSSIRARCGFQICVGIANNPNVYRGLLPSLSLSLSLPSSSPLHHPPLVLLILHGEKHILMVHDTLEPVLCKMKRSKNHLLPKRCDCHVACCLWHVACCSSAVEKKERGACQVGNFLDLVT